MLSRKLPHILLLHCSMLMAATSVAAESFTTRIETRPVRGAVITLERGVRVIRPLPPERHVIINPGNAPVSLSYNDTRVYEHRVVRHYYSGKASGGFRGGGGTAYGYFGDGNAYGGFGYGRRGFGHRGRGYGKGRPPGHGF